MTGNLLSLNPSKTEFMLIGLSQQTTKTFNPSLSLPSNHPITLTDSAPTSVSSQIQISLFLQISSLSSACKYHIRDLRRIRHTLDLKTASVIATSLVHSKLDYCNSLYLNVPQKTSTPTPATAKLPCSCSNWNHQHWTYHTGTPNSTLSQNRRAHPLQNHPSYQRLSPYLATPIPQKTYQY